MVTRNVEGMFEHIRERHGEPRVLWLHGLGEHGGCFEAIAAHPALARFGALMPDLPGYGDSPPIGAGLEELADRLAAWMPAPMPVIGHSMGGVLGVLLAERGKVSKLIDVEGNVSLGDCTGSARAAAYSLADFLARGWDENLATVRALGLREHATRLVLADPTDYHRHSLDLVRLSTPEDLALRRAKLGIPVTYIAGYPDGACPRSRELLDAAGVAKIDIAPSGHWPYIDQPDQFATAVARLL
jgi:pimeloyl-ACP methyl ester carboxylesterase